MKSKLLLLALLFGCLSVLGQAPPTYYNAAIGLTGPALQQALHNIIKNHAVTPYSSLYTAFDSTDLKTNGQIWDPYSDNPSGTPPYVYYNNSTYQCGNYNSEGDCFNREHSWPQSWFNGLSPAYSDLFHVYPTDGWVNNKRANYPYGKVNNPAWTSLNGSKLGPNVTVGYTLTVFEPIDAYKGDLARGYFYMTTRYLGEDSAWSTGDATNKAVIEPWELCVLLSWHYQDAVSPKEINRNNAIYKIQNNRNPFIDHPEWVDSIFTCTLAGLDANAAPKMKIFPNPSNDFVTLETPAVGNVFIVDVFGNIIRTEMISAGKNEIRTNALAEGIYTITFKTEVSVLATKLVIVH